MAGWDPNEKWGGGGVVGSGYWAFQLAQMTPVLKHLVCEWIALCDNLVMLILILRIIRQQKRDDGLSKSCPNRN
jgi:hypothetical protein